MQFAKILNSLLPQRRHAPDLHPMLSVPPHEYADAATRIRETRTFSLNDIALLADTFKKFDSASNTPWDDFRGATLELPAWFKRDLDPWSQEYSDQQQRLWGEVAGTQRAYVPEVDELPDVIQGIDTIRAPGFYFHRDPMAVERAANHIIAAGMLLQQSRLKPGQWALEYGAGFAQIALHLARLGVNIDTVDISELFCSQVREQADFFKVPLTPFRGSFGWNPREGQKYNLIWFYEAFHHCVEFRDVVHDIKRHLEPNGRVIMLGEPIPTREVPAVPYPWGIRIEAEVVAVMRLMHWFELGFTEDFLCEMFTRAGYFGKKFDCSVSSYGEGYEFWVRGNEIKMSDHWLPLKAAESWHRAEENGRWTTGNSYMYLDNSGDFSGLEVDATNHHPSTLRVEVKYGASSYEWVLPKGATKTLRIPATVKAGRIAFKSQAIVPAQHPNYQSKDPRKLGIFVRSVRYVP